MKVREFVAKGRVGDSYEIEAYREILSFLRGCKAYREVWTIADVELEKTQVDLLILTERGILAVDFKNYGPGNIYLSENILEINGEKIRGEEIFKQAKKQRSDLGKHPDLKEILGLPSGKFVYARILMCFREDSKIEMSKSIKGLKWFNCITPHQICSEVKNYESEIGLLTPAKINKIIEYFGGESIDHEGIIDKIWNELPKSPDVTEEERNSGKYENIFKELSRIHDDIIHKELLARCKHALALTTKDARDTLPMLLKINEEFPNYKGYEDHALLDDIFIYYFQYAGSYENGDYERDISVPSNMKRFIEKAKSGIGFDTLLKVVKKTSNLDWTSFGNSSVIWELVREFYKTFPEDPDVIEWIFFGHITEYPHFGEIYPEIVEKFFKNKELTRENGLTKFEDIYDETLLLDGLFILDENNFLKIIDELREYYPDLKSPELYVDIVSDYYLRNGEYEKAKSWIDKLDFSKIRHHQRKIFLNKLLSISWEQNDDREVYRLATQLLSQFSNEMSKEEISDNYRFRAIALYMMKRKHDEPVPYDEVINDLKKAIEFADSQYLHFLLGLIYNEKGDKDFACEEFKKVFKQPIPVRELSNQKNGSSFLKNIDTISKIKTAHIRWPIKGEVQKKELTHSTSFDNTTPSKMRLKKFQETALGELIEIYKETNKLRDLYFFIEDLKNFYEILPEIYAGAYLEFADWLKKSHINYIPDTAMPVNTNVRLADVVLDENTKEEIERILKFVKVKGKPQSILLYGPPGCGKTMIARAMANELGYELMEVSPSDVLNQYVGITEKRISNIFKKAIEKGKVVLFFDELDAIGFTGVKAEKRWEISPINEMKIWLSKLTKSDSPVLFIGATNHPDKIDKALMRPGRIWPHIKIPLPGFQERIQLFRLELENLAAMENYENTLNEKDYEYFAEITEGFTGAHINNLVHNNLNMLLVFKEKFAITKEDVIKTIREMKSEVLKDREKHVGFI